jgi:hypothetical protein
MIMEKFYSFNQFNKLVEYPWKEVVKIVLMITAVLDNYFMELTPGDIVDNPYIISGTVDDPVAMHEIPVIGNKVQNTTFFLGTAKTLGDDATNFSLELFMKNHLENLGRTVFKINGSPDPELRFIIEPEAPFPLITPDPIQTVCKNEYIIIFDLEKISGIGYDFELLRYPVPSFALGQ